jgi:RND family efflux transporter MFP subunit
MMALNSTSARLGSAVCLGVAAALTGCTRPAAEAPGPGAPTVTVSEPLQREITDYAGYTGRTAAIDSVQVRARVSGYLQKINFRDGTEVKEGTVLYEIDPRPYSEALNQAEAQVRLQQAQLKFNEATYQRNLKLYQSSRAIAQEDVQQALAQRDVSRASVEAAKAQSQQAKLNLDWTKVTAPIGGLLGRTLVTRGNLVTADQTVLTTLVSQDPMYAYFDVDEPTVLHVRELIREGKLPSARQGGVRVPVFLQLANEEGYPHEGTVDFVNNEVTPGTATLQLRGVFANPAPSIGPRVLAPGQFVHVRVAISPPYQALLVTQAALGSDQNLSFLYVLDDHDRVVRHDVTLGAEHEGLQVITKGLEPNERVIVSGVQHVKPGAVVSPRVVPMPVPRPGAPPQTPPAVLKEPPPSQAKR